MYSSMKMVRDGDDADAHPGSFENDRGSCRSCIDSGADAGDPGSVQAVQGVDQRVAPEVEGMVVGQRYASDTQLAVGLPRR
jgi:hypothetical protein